MCSQKFGYPFLEFINRSGTNSIENLYFSRNTTMQRIEMSKNETELQYNDLNKCVFLLQINQSTYMSDTAQKFLCYDLSWEECKNWDDKSEKENEISDVRIAFKDFLSEIKFSIYVAYWPLAELSFSSSVNRKTAMHGCKQLTRIDSRE